MSKAGCIIFTMTPFDYLYLILFTESAGRLRKRRQRKKSHLKPNQLSKVDELKRVKDEKKFDHSTETTNGEKEVNEMEEIKMINFCEGHSLNDRLHKRAMVRICVSRKILIHHTTAKWESSQWAKSPKRISLKEWSRLKRSLSSEKEFIGLGKKSLPLSKVDW